MSRRRAARRRWVNDMPNSFHTRKIAAAILRWAWPGFQVGQGWVEGGAGVDAWHNPRWRMRIQSGMTDQRRREEEEAHGP